MILHFWILHPPLFDDWLQGCPVGCLFDFQGDTDADTVDGLGKMLSMVMVLMSSLHKDGTLLS